MTRTALRATAAAVAVVMTAASAAPSLAQNYCERQKHEDRVNGTIIGGALGALAGGLIGGNAAGALVGGAVGAVGGNAVAASRDPKCDGYWANQGYHWDDRAGYYRPNDRGYVGPAGPAYGAGYGPGRCHWVDHGYRDGDGRWVSRQTEVCD